MGKQVLVAETDENGAVACVWVAEPPTGRARIFDPKLHNLKLGSAECYGAPKDQIAHWVALRQSEAGSRSDQRQSPA